MAQPPSFPFYPADWLLGTMTFSLAEDGAYLRLVMHQWNAGSVPGDDLSAVAKILRVSEREARPMWASVSSKFVRGDDGLWRNARVEKQRAEKVRYHEAQSLNGKQGGRPRKTKPVGSETETHGLAKTKPTGCALSLSLSEPTVQRERAPEVPARKRHNDPWGFKPDPNMVALVDLGEGRTFMIYESWAKKARDGYRLSPADIDTFARWLGARQQRLGGVIDDGGKRLPWLDARLGEWLAVKAKPNDGLRPASEFIAEQDRIAAVIDAEEAAAKAAGAYQSPSEILRSSRLGRAAVARG